MNITLRMFLILLLIVQTILIIHKIKSKKISMKYGSLWLIVIILLIIVTIFPSIIINISKLLGFEAASNMVFLIGFFALSYINFTLSISISIQNEKIKNLIQEISLLKAKEEKDEERK